MTLPPRDETAVPRALGNDLAANRPFTCSSGLIGWVPGWLVDGDPSTRGHWDGRIFCSVDLGSVRRLGSVGLSLDWQDQRCRMAFQPLAKPIQATRIMASNDNVHWTTLYEDGGTSTKDYSQAVNRSARYVAFELEEDYDETEGCYFRGHSVDQFTVRERIEPSVDKVRSYVISVDGLDPASVNSILMPNLCALVGCGADSAKPDGAARSNATRYREARSAMPSLTNPGHASMVTGVDPAAHGIVANEFWNRAAQRVEAADLSSYLVGETVFDRFATIAGAKTAAVMGKVKLRRLFDCTRDPLGNCGTSDLNPEGIDVTHTGPTFLRGAAAVAQPGTDDCQAEPASSDGIATDACVMLTAVNVVSTEDPDFTFVHLAEVDAAQHASGPHSPAALSAIRGADAAIQQLVDHLKSSGKWDRSMVIVTSDHSFAWTPDPTRYADVKAKWLADPVIQATGEQFEYVGQGGVGMAYLKSVAPGATSYTASQRAALARMATLARSMAGVSEALYRMDNPSDPGKSVGAVHPAWGLHGNGRVGDLIVTALASSPNAGPANPIAPATNSYEVAGAGYAVTSLTADDGGLPGYHGHPGTRAVPFLLFGESLSIATQIHPAIAPTTGVNEGDDTGAHPEFPRSNDIAPSIAWFHGQGTAAAPALPGRVLTSAFWVREF